MKTQFLGIRKAALAIAYDNGGINRVRSERQMLREFNKWLARNSLEPYLPAINEWLSGLSNDDLSTVCGGEYSEAQAILDSAPPFTDSLLNDYFNEVC